MPKTPMDYSKCCIYKIEHFENNNLVYVGHTTNFSKRKGSHKSICKNENNKNYNLKVYQMIRDNGGFDRFKMIEVEKYPCKDKREAERREYEVMKELKANMNAIKSFLTEEERKEYNKEYFKEKITCKCGCEVNKNSLKRHKRTKKHTDLINPIQ
jgi:hypothetical protein